ncbi:hypothetical protein KSC_031370 [Ktedonobacter sp. SOSP1-52]|uniref:hypothetical protein n=1 Tax=Ktedonobacter sp. SOSP1-52 TaxID=2778366 RepID=UPI001915B35B|nr:hypothetical protein [Ktedonobacter sp. SOSP1-52]GHO64245.1 hypothetical protein KSC_031370 [Ktedonobacter sp. SOSP1-52]
MPKSSRSLLIWSQEHKQYVFHTQENAVHWFRKDDEATFSRWLETHTSFAFVGQAGRLSALKETRPCGGSYWYAYRKQGRQAKKRYLGHSDQVTIARLEQEANVLTSQLEPSSLPPEPGRLPSGLILSSKLALPVCHPLW